MKNLALEMKNVSRSYDARKVLIDLNFSVEEGDFVALTGPSGCGKTTLVHIAGGLLAPDSGIVDISGTNIITLSDAALARFRRRNIGIVFQSFNLLNERTVSENILLPLALDNSSKTAHARERLSLLADYLGLSSHLSKRPERLSGGEQQRVAIARALIAEPKLLLADEPTGNLDSENAREIISLFNDINERNKCAIVLVSHDHEMVAKAKKIYKLCDGKIAF